MVKVGDVVYYKRAPQMVNTWLTDTAGTVWLGLSATPGLLVDARQVSADPPKPVDLEVLNDPGLNDRERLHVLYELLNDLRSFFKLAIEEGGIRRKAQAEEYYGLILDVLDGTDPRYLLAHHKTLQEVATILHQMDSIYGAVKDLRFFATAIEEGRKMLEADGFPEWDMLTSPLRPLWATGGEGPTQTLEEFERDMKARIGQKDGETNQEFGERMGLIVPGWSVLA